MTNAASIDLIKEIIERNALYPRPTGRRKKTVGRAIIWLDELDAILARLMTAERAPMEARSQPTSSSDLNAAHASGDSAAASTASTSGR